jgi:hypothetical protein
MLQLFFQTFQEMASQSPSLTVPLPQMVLMMVAISIAAMLERFRAVLIMAYSFLSYWFFFENFNILRLDRISILTVVVFTVFGLLGVILVLHHTLTQRQT